MLREDFAADCFRAMELLQRREAALGEADSRCRTLQAKIEALAPPAAVIEAEAAIRDVGEKATHVAKARLDRVNREAELAQIRDRLNALRLAVGISDDAGLEAAAPPPEAIARVQKLASESSAQRGGLARIANERQRELTTKEAMSRRQAERRAAGRHEPFGVAAADFADLPALAASAEAKRAQLARTEAEIDAATLREGFGSIDELNTLACPDAAVIQAEIERRGAVEGGTRARAGTVAEIERRDKAGADIERLMTGRDALGRGHFRRATRTATASSMRSRPVTSAPMAGAVAARPFAARLTDVELKQARTRAADDLADRKTIEANRVAALDLAKRQKSEAVAAMATLAERHGALIKRLHAVAAAWRDAWPAAAARFEDLGRLKGVGAERAALLARHGEWRAQMDALATQQAVIAERLALLEQAEAKLGLAPAGSLGGRKVAAAQGVKAHEDSYADYRRDEAALQDAELKLGRIDEEHRKLVEAEAAWQAAWRPAVAALGLDEAADPERANEIATLWAAASGHFETIRLTRNRLNRMDEDEAALHASVRGIASHMDFRLPEDGVAAARMLVARAAAARRIIIERDSLAAQLAARHRAR